ncbi:hypothetical protein GCM10017667_69230 [Streptomyces filamentosus]|uniref:Uncharacterized protein n=1 Tax=Streptomyces filamentosus TaxID=67294 RepID=A0A919BWD6_STRFL|nr:hypothetical protein GCM10017667_69230 [Streptomyces filamentosus]
MTCTFIPCLRCLMEQYGSSAAMRSMGIRAAVDDHVVALAQAGQGLVRARCPGREDVEDLVDVAPGCGCRDAEAGCQGGQGLVLPQMDQHEQGLPGAASFRHRERRSHLRA